MAKLYFRHGAMNSGKSTVLIQAAHNYEERDQTVLVAKPAVDSKGAGTVVSRLGESRTVDLLLAPEDSVREQFHAAVEEQGAVHCLLVDEAQFLTPAQVDDLLRIAVLDGVPVLAYGLRTDFRTEAFPGAARLLAVAHTVEELRTICRCGSKAMFNARRVGGGFIFEGDQVAIDGAAVSYESLCAACYLERSGGRLS
ncbi:thymidine kinase [Kocuria sp. SM24M-10]|uniref:thymidine kinase n=1 Tax=Kocuria sp. SM24M-10 TaxID=1660349 RepID=UPI00064A45BC|nr:thymidine kinase [Kocuria sp. SM24M-10]KLU11132.1 thymidine kinase [Kocuria sp. SM24M-10]